MAVRADRGRFLYLMLVFPALLILAGLFFIPDRITDNGIPARPLAIGVGAFTLLLDLPVIAFLRYRLLGRTTPGSDWIESTGEIMSVRKSSIYRGESPVAVITLMVHPPGRPPFEVRHMQQVDEDYLQQLHPGSPVSLRLDPRNPARLVMA
ncbi:hypothetical protein JW921_03990 [Candidatus Fermentibacterales bacterium]|nr:hypothetical protein [Candidatus Fermentibacterales bacterium]